MFPSSSTHTRTHACAQPQLGSISLLSLHLSLDLMVIACQAGSESLDLGLLVSKSTKVLIFKDRSDLLNHGETC